MSEIWRDIPRYEGLYSISTSGDIKSLGRLIRCRGGERFKNETNVTSYPNQKGYVMVQLYKGGHRKNFTIHRLLSITFLENPENLPQINHKDGNKQNNSLENLEWCSSLHNVQHSRITGLNKNYGEKVNTVKLKESEVLKIDRLYRSGGTSLRKLARQFNVCKNTIRSIVLHKTWKHLFIGHSLKGPLDASAPQEL